MLARGEEPVYADNWDKMAPPGWAADGKNGCRWTLTGADQDIVWYLIL